MLAARALRPLLALLALAGALALAALLLVGLSASDPGRALIAAQIGRIAPQSGLRVAIERIEGRPLGAFTAHGVRISDPQGVFLEIPQVRVDWRALALARNRLLVETAIIPEARLLRRPQLNPGDPDAPILPSVAIRIGALRVDRLLLEAPVAGRPYALRLAGSGDSVGGRLVARVNAASSAGDRLALDLDSRPDDGVFDITARLDAPVGGVVDALSGLGRPLALRVDGDGGWTRWRGRLDATLAGAPLARLALSAQDSRFGATGTVTPGALLGEGVAARLAAPAIRLEASVGAADAARPTLDLSLASAVLSLAATGTIDLGRERFDGVALSGRVLRPDAIDPALKGPPLGLSGTLAGPLTAPAVTVVAAGPSLAAGAATLTRPRLEAAVDFARRPTAGRVTLRAQGVAGLGVDIDPLLAGLEASADLRLAGDSLLVEGLTATTARARATGSARVDLATGRADAALNLALPGYAIAGLGVGDLSARAQIASRPGVGLAVAGPVEARLTRLDNATVRALTGGLPSLAGQLVLAPSGAVALRSVALASPRLALSGEAALGAGGTLSARLAGRSADYGPVTLVVAGTTALPTLDLALARPGLGVGLADVAARVRPDGAGYGVSARGASDYGPFAADAVIRTGPVLTIDLARLDLAGLVARGR